MKCRVCSQETSGSARLCATCDAAMHRAREVLTAGNKPATETGPVEPATSSGRWHRDALWIGAAVVVTAIAAIYVGRSDRPDSPVVAAPSLAPAAEVAQPSAANGSIATPLPELPQRDAETVKSARAGTTGNPTAAQQTGAATSSAAKPGRNIAAPRAAGAAALTSPSAGSPNATATSGAPTQAGGGGTPGAADAAGSNEAKTQDRWQALASALGRCGSEGYFTRVVCEERARWKYCEGAWGEVAQCPVARQSDNTR